MKPISTCILDGTTFVNVGLIARYIYMLGITDGVPDPFPQCYRRKSSDSCPKTAVKGKH